MVRLIMSKDILDSLELLCDRTDPQDKKILLLANLVAERTNSMEAGQKQLFVALSETNKTLEQLKTKLDSEIDLRRDCPVTKNKQKYDQLTFLIKDPRITFIIFIGVSAILSGFFGGELIDWLKEIIR